MATYTATYTTLGGFYDGLGILALQGVANPPVRTQSFGIVTTGFVTGGQLPPISGPFPSNNTAGNCILLHILSYASPGVFLPNAWTITDTAGNVYNLVQAQADGIGGTNKLNRVYIAENISAGPNTITVSWSNPGGNQAANVTVLVEEWTDVPASGVILAKNQLISAGSTPNAISLTATGFPLQILAYDACSVGTSNITSNYTLLDSVTNPTTGSNIQTFIIFPILTCGSPPNGNVGVPYSSSVSLVGGYPPYTFNISSGALPPGLSLNTSNGQITGTPTTNGVYTFNVHVIDGNGNTSDTPSSCSISISQTLGISCNAPPAGTVGVSYSHNFPAVGGTAPYSYAITSGSLPPGLSLGVSTGTVSGTPSTAGTYGFTITVTDAVAATAHADCGITINPPALSIICNSPPSGLTGIAYSHAFPASGGTPPYTYAIIGGSLPTGLSLDSATGIVSGTPSAAGTFPFTIQVTDSLSVTASVACSITIGLSVSITCASPPSGIVGTPYTHTFPATGGTPPYVFAITVGALPNGLTLNTSSGVVSGTPTLNGSFPFTIQVTDNIGAIASVPCLISIGGSLVINCGSPPTGTINLPYSHTFPAAGGIPPYSFAITVGALPTGLTLDTGTGAATGTPTVSGTFNFTVQVTDSTLATADVPCSIVIQNTLAIVCGSPPNGTVGIFYSHGFPASGGIGPYTFAIILGVVPDGLTLNPSTGVASGTPTTAGGYGFTVQVTDSLSTTASVGCGITIVGVTPPLVAACNNPPAGMAFEPYTHTFGALNGVPPYTFAITVGILPPGLDMTTGGVVSGEPTDEGTFPFTLQVTDSIGGTSSVQCSISIMGICPCSKIVQRNAGPPAGLSTPGPLVSSPPNPPPMTFSSLNGTIQGLINGLNPVFTVGVPLARARVELNGMVQTLNIDVVAGGNVIRFTDKGTPSEQMPHPSYPQPGDTILIQGWPQV